MLQGPRPSLWVKVGNNWYERKSCSQMLQPDDTHLLSCALINHAIKVFSKPSQDSLEHSSSGQLKTSH